MKERQKSNSIFKFSKIYNNFSHSSITIFTMPHKVMLNLFQHPELSSGFRNKFNMTIASLQVGARCTCPMIQGICNMLLQSVEKGITLTEKKLPPLQGSQTNTL